MKTRIKLLGIVILLLISSCNNQSNKTDNGINSSSTAYPISPGYPLESEDQMESAQSPGMDNSYPIESEEKPSDNGNLTTQISIPTPSEDRAVVYGTLRSLSQGDSPYIAPALYLGTLIKPDGDDSQDAPKISSISPEVDPLARQASNGDFVFVDVPPGDYGLFIWTPASAFILENEKTSQAITVKVEGGKIYDLGTIYVP